MHSTQTFIRRGDVMRLIGVTKYQLECIVSTGAVKRYRLPGMKQAVYKEQEVIIYSNNITEEETNEEKN